VLLALRRTYLIFHVDVLRKLKLDRRDLTFHLFTFLPLFDLTLPSQLTQEAQEIELEENFLLGKEVVRKA